MLKLDHVCMTRAMSFARKIYPSYSIASLAAILLSVARYHRQKSYLELESRVCSFSWNLSDFDPTKHISNYMKVKTAAIVYIGHVPHAMVGDV